MQNKTEIGVYFSANDAVYDWSVAFLNSFRAFNPDLRLILIPFDGRCERLLRLQPNYSFEIHQDSAFSRLEAIGQAFELGYTPTGPNWFRRYAAFWGPLERFLYLDARTLVLADLSQLIVALDVYGFDFLHYDCAIDQVYTPGPFRREQLRNRRGHGFLSGLWASRRHLFTIDEFEHMADDALKIREQLNRRNTDQAFINYCCDTKSVRYGHFAEVLGGITQVAWARELTSIYKQDGKFHLWDYGGQDHQKQIVLMHWAGLRLNALMPHRRLFRRFQMLNKSVPVHSPGLLSFAAEYSLGRIRESIRRNRIVNTAYHRHLAIVSQPPVLSANSRASEEL